MRFLVLVLFVLASGVTAQPESPAWWQLAADGGIVWNVAEEDRLPHEDHIEMSGRHLSAIIRYGADAEGKLTLSRRILWPPPARPPARCS